MELSALLALVVVLDAVGGGVRGVSVVAVAGAAAAAVVVVVVVVAVDVAVVIVGFVVGANATEPPPGDSDGVDEKVDCRVAGAEARAAA